MAKLMDETPKGNTEDTKMCELCGKGNVTVVVW